MSHQYLSKPQIARTDKNISLKKMTDKKNFLFSFLTSKERAIKILHDILKEVVLLICIFFAGSEIVIILLKVIAPASTMENKSLIFFSLFGEFKSFDFSRGRSLAEPRSYNSVVCLFVCFSHLSLGESLSH